MITNVVILTFMTTSQRKAHAEQPASTLSTVTRRGRLIPAGRAGILALDTKKGQFELLGPFDVEAGEGDEVEIEGVPAPEPHTTPAVPALLVRHVRRVGPSRPRKTPVSG